MAVTTRQGHGARVIVGGWSAGYCPPVGAVRLCSRSACGRPAVATLTYVYSDSTAVLGPLASHAEPHCYDLCAPHAERLTAPRGWEVVRLAPDLLEPRGPSHDDLLALADAVREAARPAGRARAGRRREPGGRLGRDRPSRPSARVARPESSAEPNDRQPPGAADAPGMSDPPGHAHGSTCTGLLSTDQVSPERRRPLRLPAEETHSMPATSQDCPHQDRRQQAKHHPRQERTAPSPGHHSAPAQHGPRSGTVASPARSARRPRRAEVVHVPLGSLTQREDRPHAACRCCGSGHVTRLSMNLTDGTPVDFTSCHHCEHRTWEHAGAELSVDGVLDRTRKVTTQPQPDPAALTPDPFGLPRDDLIGSIVRCPNTDLSAVVKAYDVRGLVGEQLDARVTRALGAAFAEEVGRRGGGRRRRMQAPRTAVVIGHDMRPSSPELSEAFADGVVSRGLDVVLIGLCSTDGLYYASGALDPPRERCSPPRTTRRATTGSSSAAPAPGRSARTPAWPGSVSGPSELLDRRRPLAVTRGAGRAAASITRSDLLRRLRRAPALAGRPVRHPAAARRRRRRQRDGRADHVPAVLGHRRRAARAAAGRRPAVLRARRHLPEPRGQPAGAGEPARPAGGGARARGPTSAWPSTATPTAASSSTSAASRSARARSPPWSPDREIAKERARGAATGR